MKGLVLTRLIKPLNEAWRPSSMTLKFPLTGPAGIPLVRQPAAGRIYARVAFAALLVLPFWLWNSGQQVLMVSGNEPVAGAVATWQAGMARFLPLLLTSVLAVAVVESLFAVLRHRSVEPGWYVPAVLFALLLPFNAPLSQVAVAISLGVVFGRLVFGGAGKYFVSPALLGALILYTGHPKVFSSGAFDSLPFDSNSALVCLAGALILAITGTVSWRILVGGLLGVVLTTGVLAVSGATFAMPWHWHLSTGTLAFGLTFLATEPGSAPLTPGGRWFLGLAAGLLTVLIRAFDPAHPDGTLHAILLAALFAPLADYLVVRFAIARRRRREEIWP